MRTVYKYPVQMSADYDVLLPQGHRVIHVELQGMAPQMWVEVDPDTPKQPFAFAITGTGHPVPDGMVHVGSWQEPPFVWHLYENPTGRMEVPV